MQKIAKSVQACYNKPMKRSWLDGKTFLISGASSGLGRGLAEKLISFHDCRIIGIGRSEKKFKDFIASLKENANKFSYRVFDVTDEAKWISLARELKENGVKIDGLINCAGMLPPFRSAVKTAVSDTEIVIKTNFLSCVYAVNAVYPLLAASDTPAIVNISSAAALATIVGTSAYSASKSALKSYTEALSLELRGKVYVSLVMPGFARTGIFRLQNTSIEDDKLIRSFCMPADKMTNKIYRGLKRKKTRMVIGKDARAMDFFYRLFPKPTMLAVKAVLRRAKIKLFEEVFDEE